MSLVVISTLTLLAIIYFAVSPHHLHFLQLVVVFLVITYLNSNYLDIVFLNFGRIKVHEQPYEILAFYTASLLLCPVMMIWGIDRYFRLTSVVKKGFITVLIMLVLLGIEWLAEWLNVFHYENWFWWLSLSKWLVFWFAAIWSVRLFDKILQKELKP